MSKDCMGFRYILGECIFVFDDYINRCVSTWYAIHSPHYHRRKTTEQGMEKDYEYFYEKRCINRLL